MFRRKQLPLGVLLASTAWASHAIAQSTPADHTYAKRYDIARRVTGTIAPDPDGAGPLKHAATRTSYDAAGRPIRQEQGELELWQPDTVAPDAWLGFTVFARVETSYDSMGRKLLEQTAKGSGGTVRWVTQYSYDAAGRLECTAVRMNPAAFGAFPASACTLGVEGAAGPDRITRNFYDAAGQVEKVQKAVGTSVQIDYVRYEYTPNGKQRAVIDANSNRAEYAYDAFDRLVKWTFPSKTVAGQVNASDYEEYGYDARSNRTSLRKRDGRTILFSYDALNRTASKTYPDGGARPVYYAYDLRGLQTMVRFDSLSGQGITNGYDGFGRLSATTAVMNLGAAEVIRNLSFLHDANGNRTRITYPDGQYVSAAWDGLDRFYFHNMSGGTNLNHATYNSEGRVTTLLRWGAGTWGSSTNFGYNGMSQLVALDHSFQNSAANVATSFSYNSARQVISRTRNNDDYRFNGYTTIDRGYARNGLNQYTAAGSAAFTYDANGNLTSDGTTTYTYDIENRLITASTGTSLATLSYDPLGRLAQISTSAGATTQFVYDGDALVAEYDGTGAMTKRYVHGPAAKADDPLVEYIGSSVASPRHLMADHQGSIIAIADVSGNRIAVNGYDEYGIPNGFAGAGAPNTGRFQYTGQAWIPELGMYHYKARIYSPTLGRFLQTDPIGYEDQVNLYAYAANDPINLIDPTGQDSELVCRRVYAVGNHCFIIITDEKGKVTDRFSYGPEKNNAFYQDKGRLVETEGDPDSPTNKADAETASSGKDLTLRINLNELGLADEDVRQSGRRTDRELGTVDKPGTKPRNYDLTDTSSNTGVAMVIDGAKPGTSGRIDLPTGYTPGWPNSGAPRPNPSFESYQRCARQGGCK